MKKSWGTHARVAFASGGLLGLAVGLAGPASAATAPTMPTELFNDYQYCATDPTAPTYLPSLGGFTLEALAQDTADLPWFTMQFQISPVSDPTQTSMFSTVTATSGRETGVSVPQADMLDGQEYAWQARGVGTGGASDWSATCYVAIDNVRPNAVPTVASANYPAGQQNQGGAPIQVAFGANGVGDVAGYVFSWAGTLPVIGGSDIGPNGVPQPENPWSAQPGVVFRGSAGAIQAPALGGSVTADLIPPTPSGLLILTVASVDRALEQGPPTIYWIFVKPDAPTITLQGDKPKIGVQTPFLLTPDPALEAISPVTSYSVVEVDDAGQHTLSVPADASGAATLHVTDDSEWGVALWVQSVGANGWVSQKQYYQIDSDSLISSEVYPIYSMGGGAGVTGTFSISSPVKGIASFSYTIDGGPATTVHAADGKARITFTPSASGWYDLEVTPIAKDGTDLFPDDYYFGVN